MNELSERAKVYWFGLDDEGPKKQFGEIGEMTPELIAALDTCRQPCASPVKERPFSKSLLEPDHQGIRQIPSRGHQVDKPFTPFKHFVSATA